MRADVPCVPDRRLAAALPVVAVVVGGLMTMGGTMSGSGGSGGLMFAVMVVLVLGSLVFGWWYAQAREKALKEWAAKIGWTYYGTDPSLVHRWQRSPFGVGSSRRVSELVAGAFGPLPCDVLRVPVHDGVGQEPHDPPLLGLRDDDAHLAARAPAHPAGSGRADRDGVRRAGP